MGTAIHDIQVETIAGDESSVGKYAGSVLLVVNVASKCGLTPQYEALQRLYENYRDQGLVVLGFPANNFLEQEPGTNDEIAEFCRTTYAIEFPLFAKISVVGADQHPLYAALTSAVPRATVGDPDAHRERLRGFNIDANEDPDILWNFEKFLISRDGTVVARFAPTVTPDDPALIAAIETELANQAAT